MGYFAIGIQNGKTEANVGTLWRSAHAFGASFIFVIGNRYHRQPTDTTKAWKQVPLFSYLTFEDFYRQLPHDCQLIGVELSDKSKPLETWYHPKQAIYLLGAEDGGLSKIALEKCHSVVQIQSEYCLNLAVAGSIVMYDRQQKGKHEKPTGK